MIIDAAHEVADGAQNLRRAIRELGLPHQVFLQRGLADEGVEKMLPLLRRLGGVGLASGPLRLVVAPVVVDLRKNLEVF